VPEAPAPGRLRGAGLGAGAGQDAEGEGGEDQQEEPQVEAEAQQAPEQDQPDEAPGALELLVELVVAAGGGGQQGARLAGLEDPPGVELPEQVAAQVVDLARHALAGRQQPAPDLRLGDAGALPEDLGEAPGLLELSRQGAGVAAQEEGREALPGRHQVLGGLGHGPGLAGVGRARGAPGQGQGEQETGEEAAGHGPRVYRAPP